MSLIFFQKQTKLCMIEQCESKIVFWKWIWRFNGRATHCWLFMRSSVKAPLSSRMSEILYCAMFKAPIQLENVIKRAKIKKVAGAILPFLNLLVRKCCVRAFSFCIDSRISIDLPMASTVSGVTALSMMSCRVIRVTGWCTVDISRKIIFLSTQCQI